MTSVLAKESLLLSCIGNTPLLKLRCEAGRETVSIYAKAEFLNPSGNTGIALAVVGAQKGYRVVIIVPKTEERPRRDWIPSWRGAWSEPGEEHTK